MKKLLIMTLVSLGSFAFATTARMNALGGSDYAFHLTDTKTVFDIPTAMLVLPESMELNYGANTIGAQTDGGMIKAVGSGRLGFFVGAVDKARTGYLGAENPFTVAYSAKAGDMGWGVLFNYSSSNKKGGAAPTDDQTQDMMGLSGSIEMGDLTAFMTLGLSDKAKGTGSDETAEYKEAPMSLGALYKMGEWTFLGHYMMNTTKETVSSVETKTTESQIQLGAMNAMKTEGADFFYGARYVMMNSKTGSSKTDTTSMPVVLGVEADAASWLTLRGSVTQNLLLGGEKKTSPDSGMDSIDHNTTVAAGMGFKFTKSTLDITLNASGNGSLNSNLGADAGFTYLF